MNTIRNFLVRYEKLVFVILVATPMVASSTIINLFMGDGVITVERYAWLFIKSYGITFPLALIFVKLAAFILFQLKNILEP